MKLYLRTSPTSTNFTFDEYFMALKTVRDHFRDNQQVLDFLDNMKPYWTQDMSQKQFWGDYYLDWHVTRSFLKNKEDADQLNIYKNALRIRIYKENGYRHGEKPTHENPRFTIWKRAFL